MEDILELLKSDPVKAIELLPNDVTLKATIDLLRREYNDLDRTTRVNQVGMIQQDKVVGSEGNKKLQKAVKIPASFQNKIVTTSTAFEVGEPVTIVPQIFNSKEKDNELTKEISRLWKVNRIDALAKKATILKKSELQCAVLCYIQDIDEQSRFNKLLGLNTKKEIKVKLLENKNGNMTPVFDSMGDMTAFSWDFTTQEGSKKVKNYWIYTADRVYKMSDRLGTMSVISQDLHGFNKIPVILFKQERPEWYVVQEMIDRIEVSMSKLGASNDYSGHPILMLYGTVLGAPNKDEDGKALRFDMVEDEETGKVTHGDAKFLTHDNAPEAVKLELDRLEKYIYSLSSTPDLSLENLKGIGDISGKAIRLMFMDAIIKSKMNEGENRTNLERIINVFISGIVTTTATKLKSTANNTFFDIKFNSILPSEINEDIQTYVQAVGAGIMSVRQAVTTTGLAQDVEKELNEIKKDQDEEAERTKKEEVKTTSKIEKVDANTSQL